MSHSRTHNESRPLLLDQQRRDYSSSADVKLEYTPLPKKQLAVLCALRLLDPLNFSQIFPYINEFIARLELTSPSQVGFYSGVVVCAGQSSADDQVLIVFRKAFSPFVNFWLFTRGQLSLVCETMLS